MVEGGCPDICRCCRCNFQFFCCRLCKGWGLFLRFRSFSNIRLICSVISMNTNLLIDNLITFCTFNQTYP